MGWEADIAKEIKLQKGNKKTNGYHVSEIVGLHPTKLSILNGEIYITSDMMDKTEYFTKLEAITGEERLKIGQKVAVIGAQKFLILDRVV